MDDDERKDLIEWSEPRCWQGCTALCILHCPALPCPALSCPVLPIRRRVGCTHFKYNYTGIKRDAAGAQPSKGRRRRGRGRCWRCLLRVQEVANRFQAEPHNVGCSVVKSHCVLTAKLCSDVGRRRTSNDKPVLIGQTAQQAGSHPGIHDDRHNLCGGADDVAASRNPSVRTRAKIKSGDPT